MNADNPLACDILIVDEVSMLSLSLFDKLVNALGPNTKLILLGDKDQLSSVKTELEYIKKCQPKVVNIGRNTRRNIELPEPTKEEVQQLISGLKDFTKVHIKENGKFWLA